MGIRNVLKRVAPNWAKDAVRQARQEKRAKRSIAQNVKFAKYPPHWYKAKTVQNYARKYGCDVFIETGTYRGDMIDFVRGNFDYLASVELGEDLYKADVERFSAESEKIHLYNGNSSEMLPSMIAGRRNSGGGQMPLLA